MQLALDDPPEVELVLDVEDDVVELDVLDVEPVLLPDDEVVVLVDPEDESSPPHAATVTAVPALARKASALRRPINRSVITPMSWLRPRSWSSGSC